MTALVLGSLSFVSVLMWIGTQPLVIQKLLVSAPLPIICSVLTSIIYVAEKDSLLVITGAVAVGLAAVTTLAFYTMKGIRLTLVKSERDDEELRKISKTRSSAAGGGYKVSISTFGVAPEQVLPANRGGHGVARRASIISPSFDEEQEVLSSIKDKASLENDIRRASMVQRRDRQRSVLEKRLAKLSEKKPHLKTVVERMISNKKRTPALELVVRDAANLLLRKRQEEGAKLRVDEAKRKEVLENRLKARLFNKVMDRHGASSSSSEDSDADSCTEAPPVDVAGASPDQIDASMSPRVYGQNDGSNSDVGDVGANAADHTYDLASSEEESEPEHLLRRDSGTRPPCVGISSDERLVITNKTADTRAARPTAFGDVRKLKSSDRTQLYIQQQSMAAAAVAGCGGGRGDGDFGDDGSIDGRGDIFSVASSASDSDLDFDACQPTVVVRAMRASNKRPAPQHLPGTALVGGVDAVVGMSDPLRTSSDTGDAVPTFGTGTGTGGGSGTNNGPFASTGMSPLSGTSTDTGIGTSTAASTSSIIIHSSKKKKKTKKKAPKRLVMIGASGAIAEPLKKMESIKIDAVPVVDLSEGKPYRVRSSQLKKQPSSLLKKQQSTGVVKHGGSKLLQQDSSLIDDVPVVRMPFKLDALLSSSESD
jgi:hypothetical protein